MHRFVTVSSSTGTGMHIHTVVGTCTCTRYPGITCFGGGTARAALAAGDAAFREEVRALLAGVEAPAA